MHTTEITTIALAPKARSNQIAPKPKRAIPPLRQMREEAGLSLSGAARRSQINHASLSRAERGLEGLSIDSLHRLLYVLKGADAPEVLFLAPFTTGGGGRR